ncbi:hypothetical protein [Neolewinella persica]|uniref:hypothetical protein n=1 Tax=Neolewinella persica TaxID=70998 RepID=UPI0012F822D2|nr:hypothetical protein [Neolewinella persica]
MEPTPGVAENFLLVKIGKLSHLQALVDKGELYMNPMGYFRQVEEDRQRRDSSEGIDQIAQLTSLRIKIGDKEINFGELGNFNGQVRRDGEKKGNVYCMFALASEMIHPENKVDSRLTEFGDHFVLIRNTPEFFSRVDAAFGKLGRAYEGNIVKYYDEKGYSGELDVFCKPDSFKHQNEFRFFTGSTDDQAFTLNIGSIRDIATIMEVENLTIMTAEPVE